MASAAWPDGSAARSSAPPLELYRDSLNSYACWLDHQSPRACKEWATRLNSTDNGSREGAVVEAVCWDWLASRHEVELNEIPGQGGVDFLWKTPSGPVLVEVSALTTAKLDTKTGLVGGRPSGPIFYSLITRSVREKIGDKAPQLKGHKLPCMLMIGTLHFEVTHICLGSLELEELLLGQRVIRGSFDPETGEASEPHSAWSLKSSVFFDEKGQSSIGHLSGVVLAGFGTIDDSRNFPLAKTCCVLNPCADYPLNTIDHPDLCFGQLRSGSLGEPARIEWVRGDGTPCDDASLCAARRWQSLKNLYQAGELELLREILRSDGVCDEPD